MARGRGALLLLLALLAFACVPLVEAGWDCADGVTESDCRSACCRSAGTPLVAGAAAQASVIDATWRHLPDAGERPISTDPRAILHVPKPALV